MNVSASNRKNQYGYMYHGQVLVNADKHICFPSFWEILQYLSPIVVREKIEKNIKRELLYCLNCEIIILNVKLKNKEKVKVVSPFPKCEKCFPSQRDFMKRHKDVEMLSFRLHDRLIILENIRSNELYKNVNIVNSMVDLNAKNCNCCSCFK